MTKIKDRAKSQAELEKFTKDLHKYQQIVTAIEKEFALDGVSADEKKILKNLKLNLEKARKKVMRLRQELEQSNSSDNQNKPTPAPVKPAGKTISKSVGKGGDNKEADVLVIQTLLKKHGAKLTVDGDYGPITEAAIFAFQKNKLHFKHPDGLISVGGMTWKGLNGETAAPVPPVSEPVKPAGKTIGKSVGKGGDNEEADVLVIQTLLKKHGAKLTVDGDYGSITEAAIFAFQKNKLHFKNPDGLVEVGGATWKGLNGVVTADTTPPADDSNPPIDDSELGVGYGEHDENSYRSQRDNPVIPDGTCNVTSLSMQLLSLANGDEKELRKIAVALIKKHGKKASTKTQLEELLRQLCIIINKGKINLNGYKCWEWAYVLNGVARMFKDYVKKTDFTKITHDLDGNKKKTTKREIALTKEDYFKKVVPALKKGAEVILSNKLTSGGHIVNLVGIKADGIIINDPYGCFVAPKRYLRNGDKLKSARVKKNKEILESRLKFNTNLKSKLYSLAETSKATVPTNAGKRNFYTWQEVTRYSIGRWINFVYKK